MSSGIFEFSEFFDSLSRGSRSCNRVPGENGEDPRPALYLDIPGYEIRRSAKWLAGDSTVQILGKLDLGRTVEHLENPDIV